jgi:hypothetical protein
MSLRTSTPSLFVKTGSVVSVDRVFLCSLQSRKGKSFVRPQVLPQQHTAQPSVPYFIRRKGQTKREAAAVDVIVGDDLRL